MEWGDVGGWIKDNAGGVAGLVGSLLTGNVPGAIAAGASLVKQATGADTPDAALAQLQQNPEALVKLREIAAANEASVRDHLFRMEQARYADIADARKRDGAFLAAGKTNTRANWMVTMAAAGTIFGMGGILLLGWYQVQPGAGLSEGVFSALLVQLANITAYFGLCLRDAFAFEFGSSRGSKDKDDAVLAALKGVKA